MRKKEREVTIKKEFVFLAIILISNAVTLVYFFDANKGYWWDETVYLGLARNLFEDKGYQINTGQETFRAPLFPFMISGIWKIFGFSETVIRLLPIIFALGSALIVYFFAKKLYNVEIALWAVLIISTTPMLIFFSEKFLTESLFIFLSAVSLYSLYIATEEKKYFYYIVSGIFISLSFLTRYPGFLLGIVYILYPLLTKKKPKTLIKNKFYILGIISLLVILSPWLFFNYQNSGSPIEFLFVQLETVGPEFYSAPWYFHFRHWLEIFGLIGFFAVPGILKMFSARKNPDKLILLISIAALIFLMLLARKEQRYLISFLVPFSIIFSIGIYEFRKWFGSKKIVPLIAIILISLNWVAGVQMIFWDLEGGAALKNAGLYLASVAPEETKIMTQNMPQIHYTSGRVITYFPDQEEEIFEILEEDKVSYIVIEKREPTYPEYVWSFETGEKIPSEFMNENFILEKSFDEQILQERETITWVYRVK